MRGSITRVNTKFSFKKIHIIIDELETFEWWISGLMPDPLFFLISGLNNACSSLVINLQNN